jgi:hypothetical protein
MSTPVFDFPPDRVDFQAAWSSCAGELVGLKAAIGLLEDESVNAFLAKDDPLAKTLRNVAEKLKHMAKAKSTQLDGYIKESARRSK